VNSGVFKYPGSKVQLSNWITNHFPDHRCYVEVFGGSAAVLANKPESYNEVFNDRDGDIVHFFRVLRERGGELANWLEDVPFSRDLHRKWAGQYYAGYRPDNDVVRAGRFFYLRSTQFAQKYDKLSGFRGAVKRNHAQEFINQCDDLEDFAARFRTVQIENLDYAELFDRYDSSETLFYCDPPYLQEGDDLYTGDAFDHDRFADEASSLEGDCIISYTDIPEAFGSEWRVREKDVRYTMRAGQDGWEKDNTERLLLNFDPEQRARFSAGSQTQLSEVVADD